MVINQIETLVFIWDCKGDQIVIAPFSFPWSNLVKYCIHKVFDYPLANYVTIVEEGVYNN